MTGSLNVIALISGGKDSFFSLLHCVQNGHKVIALANLYPAPGQGAEEEEHDLNSFMYQTVGHTVIPLYEQALQIPLYRQPIIGTAVQTGASYGHDEQHVVGTSESEDETESLIPLLWRIMKDHPHANALSTGAILSTYQRTRVESVALRLGLTPLGFLWKYPIICPGTPISLLEDMEAVGLDARIVKVASGGLDERFLWENVASPVVMKRMQKSIERFSTDGDGAVLGEGGEFETLVLDGPECLFKGRIEVLEEDRRTVTEGGGAAWLQIRNAKVVMKNSEKTAVLNCRIPEVLDPEFGRFLNILNTSHEAGVLSSTLTPTQHTPIQSVIDTRGSNFKYWTFSPNPSSTSLSVTEQANDLILQIQARLSQHMISSTAIISTTIILNSMADFTTINRIYSTLFTQPNPPSRVTISCSLPPTTHLIIHMKLLACNLSNSQRKGLHVQSRSYWAPANIGPYSQAISIPVSSSSSENEQRIVSIAGQIPLLPHTMILPTSTSKTPETISQNFNFQATLSLQHLFRIGLEMNIGWFTGIVAYLPHSSPQNPQNAFTAGNLWSLAHQKPIDNSSSDEEDRDLWEEKHHARMAHRGAVSTQRVLPDWEIVRFNDMSVAPPFFAVEVKELPRQAGIEWHVHAGIAGGIVHTHPTIHTKTYTIHQTSFSNRLQTIITITPTAEISLTLGKALNAVGLALGPENGNHASYLLDSLSTSFENASLIPCTRIWNHLGESLGAVLLFDTVLAR